MKAFARLQQLAFFALIVAVNAKDISVASRMATLAKEMNGLNDASRRSGATSCADLGGMVIGDKCLFVPPKTYADWPGAEKVCQCYDGHLVSIESSAENDVVYQLYKMSGAKASHGSIWIGYTDAPGMSTEGDWVWIDGSSSTYRNWHSYEPNNLGDQDCATMWLNDKSWDDKQCWKTLPFVCQVDNTVFPAATPPPPPSCADLGGTSSGNKCFFVPDVYQYRGSWQDGESACGSVRAGAHLASVTSQAENNVIYDIYYDLFGRLNGAPSEMWIGGQVTQTNNNGNWVLQTSWSDGSAMDYDAWAVGEPNGVNTNKVLCMAAVRSSSEMVWDDQECNNERHYICSFDDTE